MALCTRTQSGFVVSDMERDLLNRIGPIIDGKKISLPEPTLCPEERLRQRLAWRNERSLYRRECDLTGKSCISFYHPDAPYKVYSTDAWWSDNWDALEYGQDFDFEKPFFEQFAELMHKVPRMSLIISHTENSDYCPFSVNYKNCYMCVSGVVGEDNYYCFCTCDASDCIDCYFCLHCQLCYQGIQCINCQNAFYCMDCHNSHDIYFCQDSDGCSDCIGCFGLKHKKYHVFNEKVSPEEYIRIKTEMLSTYSNVQAMKTKVEQHFLKYPRRAIQMVNTENCTGDYLLNCRNSFDCYSSENLEDCSYCWNIPQGAKDIIDTQYSPGAELVYCGLSAVNSYNSANVVHTWDCKNAFYTVECFYSQNIFGCTGFKRQKNCILNKQYTEEEYNELLPKIIEYMKQTGEWNEFFPIKYSPFAYNESMASEWLPMKKEEVEKANWKWIDYEVPTPEVKKVIPAHMLPEKIEDIPDDVLNWAIECQECSKPFKIIPQELKFYRKFHLPIPRKCPNDRHMERKARINPRKLWGRKCENCKKDIQTSFAPGRPERVYCEECYLREVY